MKKYGDVIYKYRKENKMTQQDLADLLFVSPQAVSKWEKNSSEPDLATIQKLAEIFKLSVEEFFGNDITNKNIGNETKEIDEVLEEAVEPELVCLWCNNSYLVDQIAFKDPYVLCNNCKKEKDVSNEMINNLNNKSTNVIKKINGKKFTTLLIICGIIFLALIAFTITTLIIDGYSSDSLISGIILSLLIPAFLTQLFIDSPVNDVVVYFMTKSIAMPGIIFELSIDGLVFLILVKIGLGLLSLLLSFIFLCIGLLVGFVISPFTFIFVMIKYRRENQHGRL